VGIDILCGHAVSAIDQGEGGLCGVELRVGRKLRRLALRKDLTLEGLLGGDGYSVCI